MLVMRSGPGDAFQPRPVWRAGGLPTAGLRRAWRGAATLAAVALAAAISSSTALAQEVSIGAIGSIQPTPASTSVRTFVNLVQANRDGYVVRATFVWTATGCPKAAKIKFFRPSGAAGSRSFEFLTERGPFDVPTTTLPSPFLWSASLDPAVLVRAGDLIAITNLTTCGGPALWGIPLPGGVPLTFAYSFPGDVTNTVLEAGATSTVGGGVSVLATGPAPGLLLLNDRFEVIVVATNPRTGASTVGTANALGDSSGYFSLPGFTNGAELPEITVKMVDATAAPAPYGGSVWFFYSSLTDVTYTITVKDHLHDSVRTYSSEGSATFCGGADTSAFPP